MTESDVCTRTAGDGYTSNNVLFNKHLAFRQWWKCYKNNLEYLLHVTSIDDSGYSSSELDPLHQAEDTFNISDCIAMTQIITIRKKKRQQRAKNHSDNVWEKCMKTNPPGNNNWLNILEIDVRFALLGSADNMSEHSLDTLSRDTV